ncbi:hypothetical protein E4U32_003012 [Claviceps aff. humidiphila group G2b]|nr:hypothetical protein E4U32_003012 [Claviceps aff. humidiphila group G2b]
MASDASDADYSSEIEYLPDADYPSEADDSSEAELSAVQRWIDPATGLQHNLEERTVAAVEVRVS